MAARPPQNKIIRWLDYRLPIFGMLHHELYEYPTPKNLSYWWNFGSLAGITLMIMIATGIFLAMQYTAHVSLAFDSVERIRRDVNFGWLIQYVHMNGASFFFMVTYIHIFRGLYYGSYKTPRELLWMLGVVILLLMMATAFMGYVLPWGQMSFWGAKVITNLFSAIPVVGDTIVRWLWGGFTVDNPTLNRFYALHYLLPFIIIAVVFLHLIALHTHGSNNPLGIDTKGPQDSIPFHPYYTFKDMFGLAVFLVLYSIFIFYMPNALGDPQNFIPANPLQTPPEIVPEWYFLPYYAILRSVPNILFIPAKLAGVMCLFGAIGVLFILPWLDTSPVRSARFRPIYKWVFWLLLIDVAVLGVVGAHRPDLVAFAFSVPVFLNTHLQVVWVDVVATYIIIGQIATLYYFFHFIVLFPLIGWLERPLPLPTSISVAVAQPGGGRLVGASTPMEKP
jgi:quinol-cytochrome oxidoreductase complex cytochrome b subunit